MTRTIYIGIFILQLLSGGLLHAQNLISNYSFEEQRWPNGPCPGNGGMVDLAAAWMPAYGNPDYYHSCSNMSYPSFGVPQNRLGFQESLSGEAYALIGCYSINFPNAREYLWQELETSLVAGQTYRLRFNVSLADSMNFAVRGIGALLSAENTRDWSQYDFFNISVMIPTLTGPQVESSDMLTDKENWTEISGVFTASGGEKYLTIGVFRTDAELETLRVSDLPFTTFIKDESAYYIDDVILEEYSAPSGISFWGIGSFEVYPNPSATGSVVIKHASAGELMVVDAVGKQVFGQTLKQVQGDGLNVIDVSDWPSGVYLLSITTKNGQRATERLVVQH